MRERITARVLLFDAEGRILLMKGRLPRTPDAPGEWFTVGGGAKPGETIFEAAAREIVEETGFSDAVLGPEVWRREAVFHNARGEAVLFKESYIVARCAGGDPSRAGWQALEQSFVDDIRWWTPSDLAALVEPVHPPGLAGLLQDLSAGLPPEPLILTAP